MNNSIIPFVFNDHPVRTQLDDESNPWFLGKDVCQVLEISDHHQAINNLDDDERGRYKVPTPLKNQHGQFGEHEQEMLFVNEPGLYTLIFRSNKENAKVFRRWITHEVLPTLRKTGRYEMPGSDTTPLQMMRSNLIELLQLKNPNKNDVNLMQFYTRTLGKSLGKQSSTGDTVLDDRAEAIQRVLAKIREHKKPMTANEIKQPLKKSYSSQFLHKLIIEMVEQVLLIKEKAELGKAILYRIAPEY